MPELQAIIDFSIQINKFVNIDLFQRGFYQIRLSLKLPNCKFSNKIELNHLKNPDCFLTKNNGDNSLSSEFSYNLVNDESQTQSLNEPNYSGNIVLPPCVVNGMAVSKTFQINYKNEEITLNDTVSYRMNICLDILNCIKQIQKTNILLEVELWYSDQEFILNQYESLFCVSSRQLRIHLDLCRGIHYFLPVIFDYFHLSAVTISIHGCLITLCQPYICNTKNESSSTWLSSFIKSEFKNYDKKFTTFNSENAKKPNILVLQLWRLQLAQWKLVSIILASLINLKKVIDEYYRVLPPWQQAKINYETLFVEISFNNLSNLSKECLEEIKNHLDDNVIINSNLDDFSEKFPRFQENNFNSYLDETVECLDNKKIEDCVDMIEHDMAHLCGLTIEQWQRFLLLIQNPDRINQHLAKIHHFQRIKRFSEAFFCIEQPRSNLNSLCDPNSNLFLELSDYLRKSSYFINLPPCDVECIHLDGDSNTLPIIFEEKYEHFTEQQQQQNKKYDNSDSNQKLINSSQNHHFIQSPSKLSLSSSSTTSSSNSPKSNSMRLFFLSRFQNNNYERVALRNNKQETSPIEIQKLKNCHNSEIKTLELFELYKTEMFKEKNNLDLEQMNRKIKLFNSFLNKKNMIKNYSQLSLDFPNEKLKKSFKSLQSPTIYNNLLKIGVNHQTSNETANRIYYENSHSWPNLSPETILFCHDEDTNDDTITYHGEMELKKNSSRINKKSLQHKGKNNHHSKQDTQYKNAQFLDVFPIVNYRNFSGTMYFPKPPKEFSMEEIDEPDQEICMKPIPVATPDFNDDKQPRKTTLDKKLNPEILVEEVKNLTSELSLIDNKKNVHYHHNHKINNSLSFQDLTEIKTIDSKNKVNKKISMEKSKDDIYLKSNNLNDKKFTFMELLRSDHCLICCGSIEKRDDDSWPCKCTANNVSTNKSSNVPNTLTPPSFRRISTFDSEFISFLHEKEAFRNRVANKVQNLLFYSDFHNLASRIPYFQCESDFKAFKDLHLIVCVHGLDGNSADLRLVKTYLEIGLPTNNFEFLMSQRNQGETFDNLETLTERLINEIENYVSTLKLNPSRISFIGHSLGNIIIRAAISRQDFMKRWRDKFHTFLSLSGPHLGLAYNRSGLVNMGLWFIRKLKRAPSLNQLSMKDSPDIKKTFLYRLSTKPGLEYFRNILLCGSTQDYYVPIHSAHIELCTAAINDSSDYGIAYREMVENILQRLMAKSNINIVRYDVHHALNSNTNTLIGRAAHIAVLDSELFIEKFMMVVGLKYFI